MSDQTAGPSNSASSSTPTTSPHPKAISSLAKKPTDVTRQGTQKLKFIPTLPPRRKRDAEVKPEASAPAITRGSSRGRGRGEGRGGPPSARPAAEMTASGPFALGPTAMSRTPAPRGTPRVHPSPVTSGAGLARVPVAITKVEKGKGKEVERKKENRDQDEKEVYSDPDEGVEIVDMEDVKYLDWMAPDSLPRDKSEVKRKRKIENKVKTEDSYQASGNKGPERTEGEEVNLANALDLSESEEEHHPEDLIKDFAQAFNQDENVDIRQDRLYLFQFPQPFPTFLSNLPPSDSSGPAITIDPPEAFTKRVSFAPDVKPDPSGESAALPITDAGDWEKRTLDGVIGRLEVYKSGAVKMVLGNGIVLDVNAAAQASFLQHAVHLDLSGKRLCVLGEFNKSFVVSPNIDALLASTETVTGPTLDVDEGLVRMDTS